MQSKTFLFGIVSGVIFSALSFGFFTLLTAEQEQASYSEIIPTAATSITTESIIPTEPIVKASSLLPEDPWREVTQGYVLSNGNVWLLTRPIFEKGDPPVVNPCAEQNICPIQSWLVNLEEGIAYLSSEQNSYGSSASVSVYEPSTFGEKSLHVVWVIYVGFSHTTRMDRIEQINMEDGTILTTIGPTDLDKNKSDLLGAAQYNCELSGGSFANETCVCPNTDFYTGEYLFDDKTGYCLSEIGGPVGDAFFASIGLPYGYYSYWNNIIFSLCEQSGGSVSGASCQCPDGMIYSKETGTCE